MMFIFGLHQCLFILTWSMVSHLIRLVIRLFPKIEVCSIQPNIRDSSFFYKNTNVVFIEKGEFFL